MNVNDFRTADYSVWYNAGKRGQVGTQGAAGTTFEEKLEQTRQEAEQKYVGGKTVRQYREQAFDQIGANAPQSVRQAWLDAADAVGTDGMGISDSGKLDHISQLMVMRLEKEYRGEDASDLLGSSVQSAIRAAGGALYALEHPRDGARAMSAAQRENKEREKRFYQEFIRRLQNL